MIWIINQFIINIKLFTYYDIKISKFAFLCSLWGNFVIQILDSKNFICFAFIYFTK